MRSFCATLYFGHLPRVIHLPCFVLNWSTGNLIRMVLAQWQNLRIMPGPQHVLVFFI